MSNEDRLPVEHESFWKSAPAKGIFFAFIILAVIGGVTALVLQNISNTNKNTGAVTNIAGATLSNTAGAQEVKMRVTGSSYEPSTLTVKVGQPVRWVVDGTNAVGCTKYIVAQELGVSRKLNPGDNVIEFTPTKTGIISFSCSMGMVNGRFQVV
jgi:plastocyanin domain-containing protein